MQVVGGAAGAAWGGRGCWLDRLGEEVANILNVSVRGIFFSDNLYSSLGKGTKFNNKMSQHYLLFLPSHLPPITLQVFFAPRHLTWEPRISPEYFTVQCLKEVYLTLLLSKVEACFSSI